MPELTDELAELSARPVTDPTDATVQGDLQRARAALRRRRRATTAGVAIGAALATAGALTFAAHPGSSGHSHAPTKIRLVAYSGEQLPGFTVSEVPEGYVLQGATPNSLDIAEPADDSSVDAFVGKLVVMLQSSSVKHPDTSGTPVTVNGHPGYLRPGSPATVLEYTDGTHDIVIQQWQNIGLTDDQLVEFASGVTVTAAARAGVG